MAMMVGRASQVAIAKKVARVATTSNNCNKLASRGFMARVSNHEDFNMMQIHEWAGKTTAATDTSTPLAKIVADQQVEAKSFKKYQAVGSFVCRPEHSEALLSNTLSGKGVPDGMVKAWTGKMAEGFEQDSGHNVTADGRATTGAYRGCIQVTPLPTGEREVHYCVAGIQLQTAQKIKEYKSVMGLNEDDDHVLKQVPVLYPEATAQWEAYESIMDVVACDASLEFQKQIPQPLQNIQGEAPTLSKFLLGFLRSPLQQYQHTVEAAVLRAQRERLVGQVA